MTNPAPAVTVSDVADHVEHVRDVAGIDHVGIGADFDGMSDARIVGLEDVSKYPALFEELAKRGWTNAALRKLAGRIPCGGGVRWKRGRGNAARFDC